MLAFEKDHGLLKFYHAYMISVSLYLCNGISCRDPWIDSVIGVGLPLGKRPGVVQVAGGAQQLRNIFNGIRLVFPISWNFSTKRHSETHLEKSQSN